MELRLATIQRQSAWRRKFQRAAGYETHILDHMAMVTDEEEGTTIKQINLHADQAYVDRVSHIFGWGRVETNHLCGLEDGG